MTTIQSTMLSIALTVALVAIASVPASGAPFTFSNGAPAHFVAVPRNSSGIVSEAWRPASGREIRGLFAPSVFTVVFSSRPSY